MSKISEQHDHGARSQDARRRRLRMVSAPLIAVAVIAASLMAVVAPAGAAAQSVVLVRDVLAGTSSGNPTNFIDVNGTLFFTATDGTGVGGHGTELWKSDGTTAGTVLVKDINTTVSGSGTANAAPANLTNFNGTLFFTATDGTVAGVGHGVELWKSDGTAAGTQLVTDINPLTASASPANLTVGGSTLFFSATDGVTGTELWKTDGTAGNTVLVKDIHATSNSSPGNLYYANGLLYFRATTQAEGIEPWVSDGTLGGTMMLANINPANANSLPLDFKFFNGFVYFSASSGTAAGGFGNEPWRTDGTPAGTAMFKDFAPGTLSSASGPFIPYNGALIIPANDAVNGVELWTSDGTAANTVLLKDVNPGAPSGVPQNFILSNNLLYFMGTTALEGQELWKTDGTTPGTQLVKDIVAGSGNGVLINFSKIDFNGTLYFNGGGFDRQVWKSDGTAAGTVQVANEPGGSFPSFGAVYNGSVFLQYFTAAAGSELSRINNGPTAVGDAYSTNEDTPLSPAAPGLLANDTDPDGNLNTLTAAKVTDPAHGSVTVNANGSFTYTPTANYNGPDSFTYKANDGSLDSSPPSTVNITVNAVNDVPEAGDDSYSTPKDVPLSVVAPGVLGNDTDADLNALSAGSASDPPNGSVALNGDGSFNYTPDAGYSGPDSFTYVASDGLGGTDTATVTIAVTVPTVVASPASVTAGNPVTATWANIASPTATDWVGLYDSSSALDPALLAWSYTNGSAAGNLNLTVPLGATPGATYELRLFSANTYTRLATSAPFTVTASATTLSASPASVPAGGVVMATWAGIAAPTATDWVGLYDSASAPDAALLAWAYTGGSASGNLNLAVPGSATPGAAYELRLFTANTYTRIATSAPFAVVAANTTLAATPASVVAGTPVTATWSGIPAPSAADWVGLYASSADLDNALLSWSYTNGSGAGNMNLTVPIGATSGAGYELRLFSNNTYVRLATSNAFAVVASNATISSSLATVTAGNPLTATWSGIGAPSPTDWVGIYDSAGAADSAIVAWVYTGGGAAGSINIVVPPGATPGATYELRLYSNNTYTRLATSAPFTVT